MLYAVHFAFYFSNFIICCKPCESPVLCISPSQHGVWVACGNGRCSFYLLSNKNYMPNNQGDSTIRLELQCELTGPDCDPVYGVVESCDGFTYTACRDGLVRKYKIR